MALPKILIALAAISLLGRIREYRQLPKSERPSSKQRALGTLDSLGLGEPARRVNRFYRRSIRKTTNAVRARVLSGWNPLVPEKQFEACCRDAIQLLRNENPNHHFGDYLEFGVSRGTSLACMHKVLQSEGLPNVRLFGFDSFEGLPPEAKAEGWAPGAFSTMATTRRYLRSRAVNLKRVVLTKGWFRNTLTDKTRQRLGITDASLIMIDCDTYSAARQALWFCEPCIQDRAVIFFDDWASKSVEHNIGEKEAFKEFLDAFPSFHAHPLSSYSPNARVFALTRRSIKTDVMPLVAHQKQFVFGPLPVAIQSDWQTIEIAEGLVLSHCPKLKVQQLKSSDGVAYWLLGFAVRADERMSSILDGFQLKKSTEIENWTGFWAGRWVLISADRCWQDVSACLGIYYRQVGDRLWMSGSPALLGDYLPGTPSATRLPWHVTDNKGIDWIPLPFTTREGIYRLLPLRTIEPQTGRITTVRFPAQMKNIGDAPRALASTLTTIMINWAQAGFRERFVALTAGIDTRTVLAAAVAAKIKIEAFTTWSSITVKRDIVLPPRIAAGVGIPHTLRRLPAIGADESSARMAAISEHMDGTGWHRATMEMARRRYDLLNDHGQTVAHGNAFGDARCYFWAKFPSPECEAPPTDPDQILDAFTFRSSWRPEPLELWKRAFQAWIDSLGDPIPLVLDWRDRFYLEQRLGGWNSTTQRFWELLDGTTFYPGNCLWVHYLFLRFSPKRRKQGFPQREMVRLLAPQLMKIPVNPEPILKKVRKAVRSLLGAKVVYALKSLAWSPRAN